MGNSQFVIFNSEALIKRFESFKDARPVAISKANFLLIPESVILFTDSNN